MKKTPLKAKDITTKVNVLADKETNEEVWREIIRIVFDNESVSEKNDINNLSLKEQNRRHDHG
ncbi:hypothetical protein [Thalassobacillus sp. C254]|uniref:hypothetical protein n=1 Tax=Thalassobacillus sp. C254 TaxID=1225341 RepID=UPI0006D2283C|nr:hypothetical protein [Thalassobacillus sp. C254]